MAPTTQKKNHPKGIIVLFIRDFYNPFYVPMIDTIEQMADARGYGVFVARKVNAENRHVDYMELVADRADGYIFLGEGTSKLYEIEQLMSRGRPFAIIHGKKLLEGATYLTVDNENASYEAIRHLVKLGHRRILHVTAPMYHYESIERARGYEKAVREFGLEYQHKIHIDMDYETIYDMGCRLAELIINERLTAAYCFNDKIATGIIDGLMDQGIRVPNHFSVIGFDRLSFRHLSRNWIPEISSIQQPQEAMGAYAIEKVMDMIDNGVYDASKVFQCEFIEQDSVRMI